MELAEYLFPVPHGSIFIINLNNNSGSLNMTEIETMTWSVFMNTLGAMTELRKSAKKKS